MNWDRVEGQWKQRRGKAIHHWGKLMNDELAAIAGKHEQLVGILQEKYGVAKEEARQQIDGFKNIIKQLRKSNARLKRLQKASRNKRDRSNKISVKAKASSRRRSSS